MLLQVENHQQSDLKPFQFYSGVFEPESNKLKEALSLRLNAEKMMQQLRCSYGSSIPDSDFAFDGKDVRNN